MDARAVRTFVAVLCSIFLLTVSATAGTGEKEISVGYEFFGGIDEEISYGLNLGAGFQIDETTQVRVDLFHEIYNGTTWDASAGSWPSFGKSLDDATATVSGVIVSLRPYVLGDGFAKSRLRLYLQLGVGYYHASWDDLHEEDGTKNFWALVPGGGMQYRIIKNIAAGVEYRYHMALEVGGTEDFNSFAATISYYW